MHTSQAAKAIISQGVHSGLDNTAIIVSAAERGFALSTKDVDNIRNRTGTNGEVLTITNMSGETTIATPADFIVQPDNQGTGVRVVHVPTGVSTYCDAHKATGANKHQAMTDIIPTLQNTESFRKWNLVTTPAPVGVRLLLGPRDAPVVGIARKVFNEATGEDIVFDVVHYNGNTFVSDYKTTEWSFL